MLVDELRSRACALLIHGFDLAPVANDGRVGEQALRRPARRSGRSARSRTPSKAPRKASRLRRIVATRMPAWKPFEAQPSRTGAVVADRKAPFDVVVGTVLRGRIGPPAACRPSSPTTIPSGWAGTHSRTRNGNSRRRPALVAIPDPMTIQRMAHVVGVVVDDLAAAKEFFLELDSSWRAMPPSRETGWTASSVSWRSAVVSAPCAFIPCQAACVVERHLAGSRSARRSAPAAPAARRARRRPRRAPRRPRASRRARIVPSRSQTCDSPTITRPPRDARAERRLARRPGPTCEACATGTPVRRATWPGSARACARQIACSRSDQPAQRAGPVQRHRRPAHAAEHELRAARAHARGGAVARPLPARHQADGRSRASRTRTTPSSSPPT